MFAWVCVRVIYYQSEHSEETNWCFIPYRFPVARVITVYLPLLFCWILTAAFAYRSVRILVACEAQIAKIQQLADASRRYSLNPEMDDSMGAATPPSSSSPQNLTLVEQRQQQRAEYRRYLSEQNGQARGISSIGNSQAIGRWKSEDTMEAHLLASNSMEKKDDSGTPSKEMLQLRDVQRRLLLIPTLFILCRFPGFIYRIAEFIWTTMKGDGRPLPPGWDGFTLVLATFDSAQGIITCAIFVLGFREVRKAWLNLLSCRGREIPPPAVVSEYATHTYESGWGNPDLKEVFNADAVGPHATKPYGLGNEGQK